MKKLLLILVITLFSSCDSTSIVNQPVVKSVKSTISGYEVNGKNINMR